MIQTLLSELLCMIEQDKLLDTLLCVIFLHLFRYLNRIYGLSSELKRP